VSWSVGLGLVVACGNQQAEESPAPEPDPAPEAAPAKEPPPPAPEPPAPPPPATAAADGGGDAADGGSATIDGGSATAACGRPGQPLCPLQEYMKKQMQPAMRAGGEPLAETFTKVAPWAPDPSWNEGESSWRAISEAGAAAARANDRANVQKACKSCHTAWQKRYRAEFRPRPLPN
jgi:hypothetical protein